MEDSRCFKITLFCRNFTRWFLLIFSILIFIFALLSGSESFGGGIKGIIKNLPNTLPWLLLFVINWIVWKSELIGGLILIIFALAAGIFFDGFTENPFALFVITIPLLILGLMLIMYYSCQKRLRR